MNAPNQKSEEPKGKLWLLGLAAACIPLMAPPLGSGDYFWHLITGQLILEQGALPSTDIYQALSPARDWITFQWLYEVLLALLEPFFELRGIRWFHALIAAAGIWAWSLNLGRAIKARPSTMLLIAGILLFLYSDRIRIRPHVFNLLIIGALIPALMKPQEIRGALHKTLTISMIALLANIHAGGGLIALCLLLASTAGFVFSSGLSFEERRNALLFWLATAGVTLLMPGFLQGAIQALVMESSTRILFHEWQPPLIYLTLPAPDTLTLVHHYTLGLAPYLCTLTLALALIRRIFQTSLYEILNDKRLPAIALGFAAAILCMRSARFVYYTTLMLPALQAMGLQFPRISSIRPATKRVVPAAFGCLLLLATYQYRMSSLGGGSDAYSKWFKWELMPGVFPEGAAQYMAENELEGGVYNISAHHGSYLIGKLYPRIRVHYDGRGNLSPSEANAIAFLTYERWKPHALSQVLKVYNDSGLKYILTPPPAFPKGSEPPGYRLLYRDRVAELWQREATGE